jgi:hypothetical protein
MTDKNESGSCTQMRKIGSSFHIGDWWCPDHNPSRELVQRLIRGH